MPPWRDAERRGETARAGWKGETGGGERKGESERGKTGCVGAPPVCRFVNFLKLNHYLSLLNAFPGPRNHPLNLPRALCASTAGTDPLAPSPLSSRAPLMPLVARSRALLCHSSLPPSLPPSIHVLRLMTDSWPRKKVCKSGGTRQTEIHGSKCAAIVHIHE